MSRLHVAFGLAGSIVLGSVSAVAAQDAGGPAPAPAEPPCSGFMCVFGAHAAAPPQPAPQPQPQAAEVTPQPTPAATDTADEPKARPRAKAAHPVRPITIAADATEIARLRGLVAALPKQRLKIVKANGDAAGADFSVATTLGQREGTEKAKLFVEQMHIVAGPSVRSIADLKDKVVSFGADKSASQAAGRMAFAALNIPVKETPLDLDNALDGLATGDIVAVVVLAPQPDERLKRVAGSGLHLVSWPENGTLPDGATATSIDGADYPGLAKSGETIRTIGVEAILTQNEKAARLPAAKTFLSALAQHSALLSKRGFDLLKADLESRSGRRVASVEKR